MKSAKKLMLLLLSLVLLIGAFAVVALAGDSADVATVVYPDGTAETYAVGEAIVPKAFTDGLYEGKGNTLWQGDAWTFTVSGEATALADLTVTDAMVGKTIMASGAQQVYSKIDIHLPEGDYYEYITGSSYKIGSTEYKNPIYVLSGTSGTATHKVLVNGAEVEETVEYSTTKRVAGDYTVYFYDAESFTKFFSTACSLELGGVTVDHKDLRTLSDTKITATLYADHTIGNTFSWGKGYDRATNKNQSNNIAQGEGGNAKVYFDLNGHTVVNNSTSTMELTEMQLIMYSSKAGAHFYKEASSTAFYVSDGCTFFIGNNDSNTDTYSDNLIVHAKALFNTMYGYGAYVIGGQYYQTAGATTPLLAIARRLGAIQNASFYAQNGVAPMTDSPWDGCAFAKGTSPIKNCSFYSFGTSPIGAFTNGATPAYENCSFYNISGVEGAETATAKTVTFADGTTDKYFAASLEEAKAYVEGHPKAKVAPGLVEKDGVMYLDVAPQVSVAYDANFNATVTKTDGALKLVYYKVEKTLTGEIEYVCENNLAAYLVAMTHGGAKITMYQDLTTSNLTVKAERVVVTTENKTAAESAAYYLDLNGHKITFTGSGLALDVKLARFYIYSSAKGGVIDASNHTLFRSNNDDYTSIDGVIYDSDSATYKAKLKEDSKYPIIKPSNYTYLGEADNSGNKVYGDNLTVYCEKINQDMYGSGAYFNGGIFVQVGNANPSFFRLMGRTGGNNSHVQAVRNATFVTTNAATSPIYLRCGSSRDFLNCTFISTVEAGVPVSAYTDLASGKATFNFKNCNFVNVLPLLGSQYATYDSDTAYGTTSGVFSMADLDITDAEQYLAHGVASKTITVLGETCVLDGTVITDAAKALKLTREGIGTDFWAIGSVPSEETNAENKEIDGETYVPYYDYSAVDAIDAISGAVTKGGEATVAISYKALVANAFTYQVDGGEIIAVPTLGSPELDGENFVAILNNLYNVKIVMYKDIVLKSGVQFATLKDATDPKNKVVKVLDQTGYVDWDLNGCTVTVAAGAAPIAMISERESQGAQTNNVLHYTNASFKLYSSVAGGKYINETSYPIFGINKYVASDKGPRTIGSYLLGTNDPAVNGGDNLTIVSNGPISMAYETQGNGPEGYTLYINGGTYVYNGTQAMFNVAATVKIYNAKMLATGGALAMIVNQFWAVTNLDVQNLTAVSAASGTKLIESGNYYQLTANGKTHTVSIKDVAFAGGTMNLSYNNVAFTVAGEIKAPDAAGLALAYPEAPAGKSAAYTSISIYGVAAKLLAYYENPTTVTVNNTVSGLVETWLVGSTYVADAATQNLIQEDGVWYYIANPELVGKVDGAVVADICAPENAGKTVVVEIGGAKEKLYFTVSLNGVLTYYYGASAPAALPSKLAPADTQTYLITFYSDIVTDIAATTTIGGKAATIKVDLNGYTWKHNSTNNYAFVVTAATSFIYSSVPGGVLDVSNAGGISCTDSSGHAYFGEATKDGSEYGKNLTVYCKAVHNGRWWSTNGYIVGGTYIQPEGVTANIFFGIDDGPTPVVRNSTFIVNSLSDGFVRGVKGTFTNCTFIAKQASNVVVSGKSNSGATFTDCYFYNVIHNIPDGTSVTYNNCFFSASSPIAQKGGYIAYTGESVTKTVNGVDYVFGAKLVESATLVTWGYGLEAEYWVAGATATHADIILDGAFIYAFAPVTVGADSVTATASMKGFVSGKLLTQLEAQNQIVFKLLIAADSGIEYVEFGGNRISVSKLDKVDGYYVLSRIYAPSKAADTIALALSGAYNHEIELNLELYANAVLADESLAASHNLVYAMVEYVELMSGKNLAVDAPAGYETKLPAVVASGNDVDLYFSICHDYELDVAIAGAPGTDFSVGFYSGLICSSRLDETGAHKCGGIDLAELAYAMEVFYVAEGGETIRVIYTLGNYIYALENAEVVNAEAIAKLYALYNYAAYAAAYVAE